MLGSLPWNLIVGTVDQSLEDGLCQIYFSCTSLRVESDTSELLRYLRFHSIGERFRTARSSPSHFCISPSFLLPALINVGGFLGCRN